VPICTEEGHKVGTVIPQAERTSRRRIAEAGVVADVYDVGGAGSLTARGANAEKEITGAWSLDLDSVPDTPSKEAGEGD
jgi:hypothetical protein